MGFSSRDKRAWTKRIYRKSVENEVTFKQQIETDLDAAVDSVAAGQLVSVAGNGMATTFSASGLSPNDASQLLNDLDDLYDEANADLITRGEATPDDEEIRDEMLVLLIRRNRMTADFTDIRC